MSQAEIGMKTQSKALKRVGKFLNYVLGRHPDEFGLIPDPEGFVPVKQLLKALHEEKDWRHVRPGLLNELLIAARPAPIEIDGNRIRAVDRARLPNITKAVDPPKVLYIAIRKKAYASAIENGFRAGAGASLILSSDKAMALRMGMRRDNQPVLLSIQVNKTREQKVVYHQFGKNLFLADRIPAGTFSSPAPPKPRPTAPSNAVKNVSDPLPKEPMPGSYLVTMDEPEDPGKSARQRRQKQKERQKARRQARKQKKDRY
jgi:putative RNA 2'-phosphotransferase